MLTFHVTWLRDASFTATLTLRTSGTEPKIKYYSEMRGEWAKRAEVDACVAQLVAVMSEVLLEPSKNGLV